MERLRINAGKIYNNGKLTERQWNKINIKEKASLKHKGT